MTARTGDVDTNKDELDERDEDVVAVAVLFELDVDEDVTEVVFVSFRLFICLSDCM